MIKNIKRVKFMIKKEEHKINKNKELYEHFLRIITSRRKN